MLRLADNPPLVFSRAHGEQLSTDDWSDTWRVVYTKPRQEKSLARDLQERGITYFLPMVRRETISGGRRRQNFYPLFASYVFFAGDEAAKHACQRTGRVVQVLEPRPEQQELFCTELRSLATALQFAPEKVELYRHVQLGTSVAIKSGPLRGVVGTVVDFNGPRKLYLSISLLGVGAVVEIHADLVERA